MNQLERIEKQLGIIQWRRGFLNYRPGLLFVFEVVMDFDQVHAGLTDNVVFAVVGGCLHWSGSSVE